MVITDKSDAVLGVTENPCVVRSSIASTIATEAVSGTEDAQLIAATPGLLLMGFESRESAVVPIAASFVLRHGTGAGSPALVPVGVLASQSRGSWYGPNGVACPNGVFLDRTGGTTHVVVFTKIGE